MNEAETRAELMAVARVGAHLARRNKCLYIK
jgi:hypothetical protein